MYGLPAEKAAQGDHTGDGDGGQDGRNRDRAGGKQVVRAIYLREHRADHRDRRRGADEHGVAQRAVEREQQEDHHCDQRQDDQAQRSDIIDLPVAEAGAQIALGEEGAEEQMAIIREGVDAALIERMSAETGLPEGVTATPLDGMVPTAASTNEVASPAR